MKKSSNKDNIIEEKKVTNVDKIKSKQESNKSKQDNNNLSLTKQQYFNFETNNIEDDEKPKNYSKNKKSKKQKIVVVEKKVYPKFLLFILITTNLCLIVSGLYHFKLFDHNKVKTVVKKVVVREELDNNYVFLGDSITNQYDLDKYYIDMPVVNSGIGGNMTNHILKDMNERVYKYNPSKVFLLIGTNDIEFGNSNDLLISNVEKIIQGIRKNRPNCKVYLESIYPVNGEDEEKIDKNMVGKRTNAVIKDINLKLKKICTKEKCTYIDLYSELIDENDNLKLEYTREGLHLNENGYKKVTEILIDYIEE